MYKDYSSVSTHVTDTAAVKNSIRNIILTPRGTLPGKPKFGSDIHKIIFSPLDALTETMAKNYIKEALSEFETRIDVDDIQIKKIEEFNKIVITVRFSYVDLSYSDNTTESVSITVNT